MFVWVLFRLTCVLANKAPLPDVIQVGQLFVTNVLRTSHFARLDTCAPPHSSLCVSVALSGAAERGGVLQLSPR